MKRRSSHYRDRTFNARLLNPSGEGHSSDSFGFLSRGGEPGARAKRIFVIRQAIPLPPTNSTEGKNAQHILIFDDHPESLRLVFGSTTPKLDLSRPPRASSSQLILLSILAIGLLLAILWPLL
jgi:hypothetical protein